MIVIKPLPPEEFTADLARPIFEEVAAGVPDDRDVRLDMDYVVRRWRELGEAGLTKTWVANGKAGAIGMLGALFIEEFWSGLPMAMEQFWFVRKDSRWTGAGALLFEKFEEEAKLRKCQTVWAGSNTFHKPDRMARKYQSMGFELWGQNFRKVISR